MDAMQRAYHAAFGQAMDEWTQKGWDAAKAVVEEGLVDTLHEEGITDDFDVGEAILANAIGWLEREEPDFEEEAEEAAYEGASRYCSEVLGLKV